MALPISHTPVLKGHDSKKFNAQLKKSSRARIKRDERLKGMNLVKAILKNANI